MKRFVFFFIVVLLVAAGCATVNSNLQSQPEERAKQILEELQQLHAKCMQIYGKALVAEYENPAPFGSHSSVERLDAILEDCFKPECNELLKELQDMYCPVCSRKRKKETILPKKIMQAKNTERRTP